MHPDIREALTNAANSLTREATEEGKQIIRGWIDTLLDYANTLKP